MIFAYLRVKPPITIIIENKFFEGFTYRIYILLLFDFVFDFQPEQFLL